MKLHVGCTSSHSTTPPSPSTSHFPSSSFIMSSTPNTESLQWSPIFNDPSPESIILRTTDDVLFAIPTFLLQAAFPAFRGLMSLPQPASDPAACAYTGQNAPGVLPEVKLDDVKGDDLEIILRFADAEHATKVRLSYLATWGAGFPWVYARDHRKQTTAPTKAFLRTLRLVKIVDKYAMSDLIRATLVEPLLSLDRPEYKELKKHFIYALAVGLIIQDTAVVTDALKIWADEERVVPADRQATHNHWMHEAGQIPMGVNIKWDKGMTSIKHVFVEDPLPTWHPDWVPADEPKAPVELIDRFRPTHVSDLDPAFWEVIPGDTMRLLLKFETKVTHSVAYSWREAAPEFVAEWRRLGSFRA